MEIWKKMWVGVFFWTQCSSGRTNTWYSAKSRVRVVAGKFSRVYGDYCVFSKWGPPTGIYFHTKFCECLKARPSYGHLFFSKWRPAAILNFAGSKIWCHRKHLGLPHTKFGEGQPSFGDLRVFQNGGSYYRPLIATLIYRVFQKKW